MLGSAQRRRRAAILQHGSLPLVKNPFEENVLSVVEATGRSISFDEMSRYLVAAFAETVSCQLVVGRFTQAEWAQGQRLAQEKLQLPPIDRQECLSHGGKLWLR